MERILRFHTESLGCSAWHQGQTNCKFCRPDGLRLVGRVTSTVS